MQGVVYVVYRRAVVWKGTMKGGGKEEERTLRWLCRGFSWRHIDLCRSSYQITLIPSRAPAGSKRLSSRLWIAVAVARRLSDQRPHASTTNSTQHYYECPHDFVKSPNYKKYGQAVLYMHMITFYEYEVRNGFTACCKMLVHGKLHAAYKRSSLPSSVYTCSSALLAIASNSRPRALKNPLSSSRSSLSRSTSSASSSSRARPAEVTVMSPPKLSMWIACTGAAGISGVTQSESSVLNAAELRKSGVCAKLIVSGTRFGSKSLHPIDDGDRRSCILRISLTSLCGLMPLKRELNTVPSLPADVDVPGRVGTGGGTCVFMTGRLRPFRERFEKEKPLDLFLAGPLGLLEIPRPVSLDPPRKMEAELFLRDVRLEGLPSAGRGTYIMSASEMSPSCDVAAEDRCPATCTSRLLLPENDVFFELLTT